MGLRVLRTDIAPPRTEDPPKRTRNVTKFITQAELWALRDVQHTAMYGDEIFLAHGRRGTAWRQLGDVRPEIWRFGFKETAWMKRKWLGWGAYIKTGPFRLALVEPNDKWPFELFVIPWFRWQYVVKREAYKIVDDYLMGLRDDIPGLGIDFGKPTLLEKLKAKGKI